MVNLVLECEQEKAELKEKKQLERQVSIVSNSTEHYQASLIFTLTFLFIFLLQGKGINTSEGKRKKHDGDDRMKVPQTGVSIMMNIIEHDLINYMLHYYVPFYFYTG